MTSHILLTGPPGVGKTTVCKKVISILEKRGISYDGFYTQEVRGWNDSRIGFDIVRARNLDRVFHAPLARLRDLTEAKRINLQYQLGHYQVFLDDFEAIALPALDSDTSILVIDEIGKMELLSRDFKKKIMDIFFDSPKKVSVLGTIPHKYLHHATLFKKLYADERTRILNVFHKNRNNLPEEIVRHFV